MLGPVHVFHDAADVALALVVRPGSSRAQLQWRARGQLENLQAPGYERGQFDEYARTVLACLVANRRPKRLVSLRDGRTA